MSTGKSTFINCSYYFGFQHKIKIIPGWKREVIFKSSVLPTQLPAHDAFWLVAFKKLNCPFCTFFKQRKAACGALNVEIFFIIGLPQTRKIWKSSNQK